MVSVGRLVSVGRGMDDGGAGSKEVKESKRASKSGEMLREEEKRK